MSDIPHDKLKRDPAAKALEGSKLSEGDRALIKRFVN
jgi:hypothetical protein